jgi:hypothetical protein
VSNFIVSIETAMATHSMLHAIGSSVDSTIQTHSYIAKDIIGQLGGLGYMTKVGQRIDREPKRFLVHSNIIQQTAITSMCVTPFFSSYFLPVAGLSSILTNISFTGFGAINVKCIRSISDTNNMGEVYAKLTMLNTLGSSLGLLVGIGITIALPDHGTRLCFIPLLAGLRVYTFNKAIRGLI